jgi:ankyrin repeat protein
MNPLAKLLGRFSSSSITDQQRAQNVATLAAHTDFKAAVRESNLSAIEEMFRTKRISLSDELDRGRGLLQFAVMVDKVKSVRLLIALGADPARSDTLGASASKLARKKGSESMAGALAGQALPVSAAG